MANGQRVTDLEKLEIVNRLKLGLNRKEIAKELNISHTTVINVCKAAGLGAQTAPTKELMDKASIMYLQGVSVTDIAKSISYDRVLLGKKLKSLGLKIVPASERKQIVKSNIFECLNDEAYYWLGQIAADGNVHSRKSRNTKPVVSLVNVTDSYLLDDFIKFTRYSLKVRTAVQKNSSNLKKSVDFTSSETAYYLHSVGITERKSMTLKVCPSIINYAFLTGVLDADGSVFLTDKKFPKKGIHIRWYTASFEFYKQITNFLETEGYTPSLYLRKGTKTRVPFYTIRLGTKGGVVNFLEKIRLIECPRILRKREAYELYRKEIV